MYTYTEVDCVPLSGLNQKLIVTAYFIWIDTDHKVLIHFGWLISLEPFYSRKMKQTYHQRSDKSIFIPSYQLIVTAKGCPAGIQT